MTKSQSQECCVLLTIKRMVICNAVCRWQKCLMTGFRYRATTQSHNRHCKICVHAYWSCGEIDLKSHILWEFHAWSWTSSIVAALLQSACVGNVCHLRKYSQHLSCLQCFHHKRRLHTALLRSPISWHRTSTSVSLFQLIVGALMQHRQQPHQTEMGIVSVCLGLVFCVALCDCDAVWDRSTVVPVHTEQTWCLPSPLFVHSISQVSPPDSSVEIPVKAATADVEEAKC